ncbi:hypothetical protein [Streptomyces johnsoniae]|uniref:Uncharacterized protein n=1 Tax=Streptomyces johnsoniae TaxID=3075532 RepID=A0ABU2SBB3_9ACTN|nr:hypothetical protein [Streptomyces sp. DSM 41886]MDT0445714.1 hypothetical protein [Streptomyces sp. DSM 41886]
MTEVSIRFEARPHVYAELVAPDGSDDQLDFAVLAVDALFALGDGLFEPLAVNVELACCDAEFGYPLREPEPTARFHQLRVAAPPEWVRIPNIWNRLLVARRERLDRAVILDWFRTILAQQECSGSDTRTGWIELIVEAVRVRLPEATRALLEGDGSDGSELPVSCGNGVIRFPVEKSAGELWVAGPLDWYSGSAPFGVRIVNEAGNLSLDLSLNWLPWIDEDGAGPAIGAAVGRLSAMGWDVVPADRKGV